MYILFAEAAESVYIFVEIARRYATVAMNLMILIMDVIAVMMMIMRMMMMILRKKTITGCMSIITSRCPFLLRHMTLNIFTWE